MNMMQMVGIMVAMYVLALTAICVYRKAINTKIVNGVFIAVDTLFYLAWAYASYLHGWSDGFMMLDNISPLIMSMMPISLFLLPKVKEMFKCAAAFLWLGMFVALIISPQHAYIFNNHVEASPGYSSEAACHLIASLYGIYLIITEQVKCNIKSFLKACAFLYSAIGFGVICNYIFHSDNFGMNPYGGYSIYMIDIFGSFEATLAAYLIGVLLVILLGAQMGLFLFKLITPIEVNGKEYPLPSAGIISIIISLAKTKLGSLTDTKNDDSKVSAEERSEKSDQHDDSHATMT